MVITFQAQALQQTHQNEWLLESAVNESITTNSIESATDKKAIAKFSNGKATTTYWATSSMALTWHLESALSSNSSLMHHTHSQKKSQPSISQLNLATTPFYSMPQKSTGTMSLQT
jgi:hypothetical protein